MADIIGVKIWNGYPDDDTITNSSTIRVNGHYRFLLQVNSVVVLYGRSPINTPLPGGTIILIDLGQQRVQVTISGLVDRTPTDNAGLPIKTQHKEEGGVAIAHRSDIEEFTREWDERVIALEVLGEVYQVKIANVRLTLEAPNEFWDYVINFVGGRPEDIDSEQIA